MKLLVLGENINYKKFDIVKRNCFLQHLGIQLFLVEILQI